jgi:pimeloyl-ACP methyl ester carboxylesterase
MNPSIPNQYDPSNACFLAGFAGAAYEAQAQFAGWKTNFVASHATDTRALIACDGQDCLVAFRGTQDLRNWLTDLDCAFTRLGNMRLHRGFYAALESVREELEAEIAGTQYQRLWLTGHSLGGALAMLCARAWHGAVEGVYTFGQPRAGDAAFRDDFNARQGQRAFRIIHADDVVARVPWLLGAYRHAGHEIFYPSTLTVGRDSVEPCQTQSGFDRVSPYRMDLSLPAKLVLDIPGLFMELRRGKLALLDDHHISRYLALFPARDADCYLSHHS